LRPGDFVDYYEILGLPANASPDDVREAWRRAARQYHPDLNPRKTSFRFRRAREAYDVLSDPQRRKEYDRLYRVRTGLFGRTGGSRRTVGGTPPGARNPPPSGTRPSTGSPRTRPSNPTRPSPTGPSARPSGSRPTGSTTRPPTASGRGSSASPGSRPPGARGAPSGAAAGPTPGPSDVRSRTTFRPATVSREMSGANMVDYLKDAVAHGGASRVSIRHNGNVVWQTHITSAILDDIARWLVGPLMALLRLLGQDEKFQIDLTDELMEEYNRANSLFDAGKLPEAKDVYKKCIDRDKYFAPAHLSLGAVYEAQQDIPVAIQCYRNAVTIDPSGEAGRFARENLRRLRGY